MYPNLAKFALPYICLQATSVPAERIFSMAGEIVSNKRNRIDPNMVNMLIFLNKNWELV